LKEPYTEETIKSLIAIKQLVILLLSRDDLLATFLDESRKQVLETVSDVFWKFTTTEKSSQTRTDREMLAAMSELMFILASAASLSYLESLSIHLVENFEENVISVQISLLALVNRCIAHCKEHIPLETIDNLIRILSRVFHKAAKMFDADDPAKVHPLLSVAAATVSTIINSKHCVGWDVVFHKHALPLSIISVANLGIKVRLCI